MRRDDLAGLYADFVPGPQACKKAPADLHNDYQISSQGIPVAQQQHRAPMLEATTLGYSQAAPQGLPREFKNTKILCLNLPSIFTVH